MFRSIIFYFFFLVITIFTIQNKSFSKVTLGIFFLEDIESKTFGETFYNFIKLQFELNNFEVERVNNLSSKNLKILLKIKLSYINHQYRIALELKNTNESFLKKIIYSSKIYEPLKTFYSTIYSQDFLEKYTGLNHFLIGITNKIVKEVKDALKKWKINISSKEKWLHLIKDKSKDTLDIVFIIQGNNKIWLEVASLRENLEDIIQILKKEYPFLEIRIGIILNNSTSFLDLTQNTKKIKNYLNSYFLESSGKLTLQDSINTIHLSLNKMSWNPLIDAKRFVFFLSDNNFNSTELFYLHNVLDFKNLKIKNQSATHYKNYDSTSLVLPIKFNDANPNENYLIGNFYNYLVHQLIHERLSYPIKIKLEAITNFKKMVNLNEYLSENKHIRYIFSGKIEKRNNFYLLKFRIQDILKDTHNQNILSLEYPIYSLNDLQSLVPVIVHEVKKASIREADIQLKLNYNKVVENMNQLKNLIFISNTQKTPIYFIAFDQVNYQTKLIFLSLSRFFKSDFLEMRYYFSAYEDEGKKFRKKKFQFYKETLFEELETEDKWHFVSQFKNIEESHNFIKSSGYILQDQVKDNIIPVITKSILNNTNMVFKDTNTYQAIVKLDDNTTHKLGLSKKDYISLLSFMKVNKKFFIATSFSPIQNNRLIPNFKNFILIPYDNNIKQFSQNFKKMQINNTFYFENGIGENKLWILNAKIEKINKL